jgi:S-DNA-T family DNA segregation ATPase FtsK/SpoIIIE
MVETPRYLLDDLAEVLGGERINAADAPTMLRKLAPNWAPYKNLTGSSLRTQLDKKYGVKVPIHRKPAPDRSRCDP